MRIWEVILHVADAEAEDDTLDIKDVLHTDTPNLYVEVKGVKVVSSDAQRPVAA